MALVILRWLLYAGLVAFGGTAVTVDVTPSVIDIGQTESLEVTCRVKKEEDHPNILFFITLSHSPSSEGSNFSYLAYVNSLDSLVKLTTPDTAIASGVVNSSGDSHIRLTWRRPALNRAGVYKCEVGSIDAMGRPVTISELATVTASGDDGSAFWKLSDNVADLYGRIHSSQENKDREVAEIKNETSNLQNQIDILRSDQASSFRIESGSYECGELIKNFSIKLEGTWKAEDSKIFFKTPFRTTPKIIQSVIFMDVAREANLRMQIEDLNVTSTGFVGRCKTWSNTIIFSIGVKWTAISFPIGLP